MYICSDYRGFNLTFAVSSKEGGNFPTSHFSESSVVCFIDCVSRLEVLKFSVLNSRYIWSLFVTAVDIS